MTARLLYVPGTIKIVFLLLLILTGSTLYAQNDIYRVFLKDKGPESHSFEIGSALYDSTVAIHNERCVNRRLKVKDTDALFSIEDAPVYSNYLKAIKNTGAEILLKLRWHNYVVIRCDSATAESIKYLDFVNEVQSILSMPVLFSDPESIQNHYRDINDILGISNCGDFDYGASFLQADMIKVTSMHKLGITGEDVLVGFLDTGFRWKDHSMLKNANVIGEYDLVFGDSITSIEFLDKPSQPNHGTAVFSTVAAFSPGKLIGIAPNAMFMLAKTEDLRSETRLEEDNYAAAIEWMESRGVDITSSSLGYYIYDSLSQQYSYSDLNGKTTISSKAINAAVSRGVLCLTAAGNSGPLKYSISTPADADSAITVGAAIEDGIRPAGFTSRGPRGDGAIKPDISALGVNVVSADASNPDLTIPKSGTSLSTPLLTGSAALLLSVFPELKPWEIRNALYQSSAFYPVKDTALGFGVPDILEAARSIGTVIAPPSYYKLNSFNRIAFFILPTGNTMNAVLNIKFKSTAGFTQYQLYATSKEDLYAADIPLEMFEGLPAEAFLSVNTDRDSRRYPYKEGTTFTINPDQPYIPCGITISGLPVIAESVNNSFIYPIVIDNGTSARLNVFVENKSSIDIKIFNSAGMEARWIHIDEREPGYANIPLQLDNFASGSYFVYIESGNKNETVPFVILR